MRATVSCFAVFDPLIAILDINVTISCSFRSQTNRGPDAYHSYISEIAQPVTKPARIPHGWIESLEGLADAREKRPAKNRPDRVAQTGTAADFESKRVRFMKKIPNCHP